MKRRSLSEQVSVLVAKSPAKAILLGILLFNICFLFLSALIIYQLKPASIEGSGFWATLFYAISMILDPGCISFVITEVGRAGAAVIIVCLVIVVIGMIMFTGAVIGYLTNTISGFIEQASTGRMRLKVSGHSVIINWNSRAAEIINDHLYCKSAEKIVVLVSENSREVEREIADRISDTLTRENRQLYAQCRDMRVFDRHHFMHIHRLKNKLTVIVREGNVFSEKQLSDISLDQAKAVFILCKDTQRDAGNSAVRGNSSTLKTLIQVADIVGSESSADAQKIVVEVDDVWTNDLVATIIAHKERCGKSTIVPVYESRILGQIFSQFCVMPDLYQVYGELFSNKGAFFASEKVAAAVDEDSFIRNAFDGNELAIPLTFMDTREGRQFFYIEESDTAGLRRRPAPSTGLSVCLKPRFSMESRNVIILGHNSKMSAIMEGFSAFRNEWCHADDDADVLSITLINDPLTCVIGNDGSDVPFVSETISTSLYEKDRICNKLKEFFEAHADGACILILSDDTAAPEDTDANALTYLIYVEDVLQRMKQTDELFDPSRFDVIVEVLDPKHYNVANSYSTSNVIISNRFVSKMITQIGMKKAIFGFFCDILTYDNTDTASNSSKELYIRQAKDIFSCIPEEAAASELIRAVYDASNSDNRILLLGFIDKSGEAVFFSGNKASMRVRFAPDDKLILFCGH